VAAPRDNSTPRTSRQFTGAEFLIGKTADLPDPRPERCETFTFVASERSWEP